MIQPSSELANRLAAAEETGLDPALFIPLLGLLAVGGPVDVAALAAECGRSVEQVQAQLARVPDTEYDDRGRIVGQGLTLSGTQHRAPSTGRSSTPGAPWTR